MELGMLNSQPKAILFALLQRTWCGCSPVPIPNSVVVTTWVVEVGAPIMAEVRITAAEPI